ncbi:MAG TPA: ABC transporter permease [bacterium]|nr:ABC transporter permease [bacterium]
MRSAVEVPFSLPRRRSGQAALWLAIAWTALLAAAALAASWLPLRSPIDGDLTAVLAHPGGAYWLGTDSLGRDLLARCIFGARVSLMVALGSIAIGALVGGSLGLVAGFFGGLLDRLAMDLMTVLLCFPALILAIAIIASLGPSLATVTLAIGVLFIPAFARVARANTLTFRQQEFVLAAEVMGARAGRILIREILPNILPSLLSLALVLVGVAILAEASLGFLGLSVTPPTPSWGGMIATERGSLTQAPHVVFVPALFLFLTVLAMNVIGERIRRMFDIKNQAV